MLDEKKNSSEKYVKAKEQWMKNDNPLCCFYGDLLIQN